MKIERITDPKITMLVPTPKEALEIIKSLSDQLIRGCCNGGRAEHSTADGEYVSIAVDFDKDSS